MTTQKRQKGQYLPTSIDLDRRRELSGARGEGGTGGARKGFSKIIKKTVWNFLIFYTMHAIHMPPCGNQPLRFSRGVCAPYSAQFIISPCPVLRVAYVPRILVILVNKSPRQATSVLDFLPVPSGESNLGTTAIAVMLYLAHSVSSSRRINVVSTQI